MSFEYPLSFLFFLVFFALILLVKSDDDGIYFSNIKFLKKLSLRRKNYLNLLKYLGISLLIIASSSPIKEDENKFTKKRGYDIALIIDASASMKEFSFANSNENRFQAVKDIVNDFISHRKNDNIALIVFGDYAYTAVPLSFDKNILSSILAGLTEEIAGKKTALYDSLMQGVKTLKNSKAKAKVIVLLTDGINNIYNVPKDIAIESAKKYGIKVYTIGIGRKGEFDAYALKNIAKETKAKFFQASNKKALENVYKEIDKLEKSDIKDLNILKKKYLFAYFLVPSFISLFLYILLINFRRNI